MAANSSHSRIKRLYAAAGILLLNTLLLCACIEGVAWLILSWTAPHDKRPDLPPYRELWGDDYWREFAQSEAVQYWPYVLWRRIPYSGTMIHVDDRGLRLTPGADCQEGAFTVFAFGGSTMWGTGARDGETIPAYLQAGLQAIQDGPVCVVNFGESGYVSTQSLITLITELQAGHVPDWVIFYDGINDTVAAYQTGKAGTHQNEGEIAARARGQRAGESPAAVPYHDPASEAVWARPKPTPQWASPHLNSPQRLLMSIWQICASSRRWARNMASKQPSSGSL